MVWSVTRAKPARDETVGLVVPKLVVPQISGMHRGLGLPGGGGPGGPRALMCITGMRADSERQWNLIEIGLFTDDEAFHSMQTSCIQLAIFKKSD